jgi:hypothetical protein
MCHTREVQTAALIAYLRSRRPKDLAETTPLARVNSCPKAHVCLDRNYVMRICPDLPRFMNPTSHCMPSLARPLHDSSMSTFQQLALLGVHCLVLAPALLHIR